MCFRHGSPFPSWESNRIEREQPSCVQFSLSVSFLGFPSLHGNSNKGHGRGGREFSGRENSETEIDCSFRIWANPPHPILQQQKGVGYVIIRAALSCSGSPSCESFPPFPPLVYLLSIFVAFPPALWLSHFHRQLRTFSCSLSWLSFTGFAQVN